MSENPAHGQIFVHTADGLTYEGVSRELGAIPEGEPEATNGQLLDEMATALDNNGMKNLNSVSLETKSGSLMFFNPDHVVAVEIRRW